jgi:AefR-like transcriptional repressor, C-terminal domain
LSINQWKEKRQKDGCLAVNPTMAAEQFLALVRGGLHLHCLYDPSFRPSRAKIERQIEAGIDCFMARHGAPEASTLSRERA